MYVGVKSWLPVALALVVVACSSGGDDESAPNPETSPVTTVVEPATTVATSTTTTRPPTTTRPATTTTTVPAGPVAPLTGLEIDDASVINRPALIVKLDNHEGARPHSGLNQADIVVEELVEGISRFFVVFHSQDAAPFGEVGPIRSARTTDVDLLSMFGRPLFAWSGANRVTGSAILNAGIVDVGANAQPRAYRRGRGTAPHNLFSNTGELYTFAEFGQEPPHALFEYMGTGDEPNDDVALPAVGVKLSFDAKRVLWEWDETTDTWLRSTGDGSVRPHADVIDEQINAENVVVLFTNYGTSPADPASPEAKTVGSGEAWVFIEGVLVQGRWDRSDRFSPPVLTDLEGEPIALSPGRTWIELPEPGRGIFIADGASVDDVPFP